MCLRPQAPGGGDRVPAGGYTEGFEDCISQALCSAECIQQALCPAASVYNRYCNLQGMHLVDTECPDMVFPVVMYGCESWTVKKAECQKIDAFELWCWRRLTLESPLDCKEIQPVHPEGDKSCVFIGRTDAEAETPILWPPQATS